MILVRKQLERNREGIARLIHNACAQADAEKIICEVRERQFDKLKEGGIVIDCDDQTVPPKVGELLGDEDNNYLSCRPYGN